MTDALLQAASARVQQALAAKGFPFQVQVFPAGTRTAAEAASAIGCTLGQIAKSLVFRTDPAGVAVLVVASGANKVDEAKVAELIGETVARADADFVRAQTGFAIGGVLPVGHLRPIEVLLDRDLETYDQIWAAAGTPDSVFRLSPADLAALTKGRFCDVRRD